MPFNGSGSFSPPGSDFPAVSGTLIESSKYNNVVNDVATGLSSTITKDGQTTITANLPMAGHRHTGVGDAINLTDYASANQVVDGALTYGGASAAGTDTYAVNLAISPGAYAAGQRYQFKADVANTGACTINFNSIGAAAIKTLTGTDPLNGQITAGHVVDVMYDGTNFVILDAMPPKATPNEVFAAASNDVYVTPQSLVLSSNLSSPGYMTLPGSLVMEWGASGVGATSTGTFSIIQSCFACFVVAIGSSGTAYAAHVVSIGTTAASLYVDPSASSSRWLALGTV